MLNMVAKVPIDEAKIELLIKMHAAYGRNGVVAFSLLQLSKATVEGIVDWLNKTLEENEKIKKGLNRVKPFKESDFQAPLRDLVNKNKDLNLGGIQVLPTGQANRYVMRDPNDLFRCLAEIKAENPKKTLATIQNTKMELLNEYYKKDFPIGSEEPFNSINNRAIALERVKSALKDSTKEISIFAFTGSHIFEDLLPLLREKIPESNINCRVIANNVPNNVRVQLETNNIKVKSLKRHFDGREIDKKGPMYPLRFILTESWGFIFQRELEKGLKWATEIKTPSGDHILLLFRWVFDELWDNERYTG